MGQGIRTTMAQIAAEATGHPRGSVHADHRRHGADHAPRRRGGRAADVDRRQGGRDRGDRVPRSARAEGGRVRRPRRRPGARSRTGSVPRTRRPAVHPARTCAQGRGAVGGTGSLALPRGSQDLRPRRHRGARDRPRRRVPQLPGLRLHHAGGDRRGRRADRGGRGAQDHRGPRLRAGDQPAEDRRARSRAAACRDWATLSASGTCSRRAARSPGRTANWACPPSRATPEIVTLLVEDAEPCGPFGAKGISEVATVPVTPAILNAVFDAIGYRAHRLPADAAAIRQYLHRSS